MYLRDICPIVQSRAPEWCRGNWKKGVHQVLIDLLEKGVLCPRSRPPGAAEFQVPAALAKRQERTSFPVPGDSANSDMEIPRAFGALLPIIEGEIGEPGRARGAIA